MQSGSTRRKVSVWPLMGFVVLFAGWAIIKEYVKSRTPPLRHTTLSFRPHERSGVPLIWVRFGDLTARQFVLDTGSSMSLLNASGAHRLGLSPRPVRDPNGRPVIRFGDQQGHRVVAPELQLGSVRLLNAPLWVVDDGHLKRLLGEGVEGIVGTDLLNKGAVCLDFAAQEVTFWFPGGLSPKGMRDMGFTDPVSLSLSDPGKSGRYRVPVRINDRASEDLLVDTGAHTTRISRRLAHQLKLKADPGRFYRQTMYGPLPCYQAPVRILSLGDLTVENLRVVFSAQDDPMPPLLGVDVLSRSRVLLDFPARRIVLQPTASERRTRSR